METLTNKNGIPYYAKIDSNGQRIYSFSADFDDIWTDEAESSIVSGTTPSKL